MSCTAEKFAFKISRLAEPSRNFNFLAVISLIDPRDDREKIVISNFAGGGVGSLIFVDVATGATEVISFPRDEGAWAVLLHEGRLIVGTCSTAGPGEGGAICALDLKTREWSEPLRRNDITYVWMLTLGSDGMVYGGTCPTGALIRCDPACTRMEDLGNPTGNLKNKYCREVHGTVPGFILVTGGFATAFLSAYKIATGEWITLAEADGTHHFNIQEITEDCISVEHESELIRFDARTLQRLPGTGEKSPQGFRMAIQPRLTTRLRDGREAGVRGQEYFIGAVGGGDREFHALPVEPPVTAIRSLALDAGGNVWGSCGFGQTIFRYHPADGTFWNSQVVTERMGEAYGMVFVGGLLFMSCYAGGDHVVYDPAKPWDERGNINPRTLDSLFPQLQRPRAGSVLGPDGGIWTGWSAKYGCYGGGLSRIDPVSFKVTSWLNPVPGQQVMGISCDRQFLYFSTNSGGEGLPVRDEPGWFCIWHPVDGLVGKHPLAPGDAVGKLRAVGGFVLVMEGGGLQRFDGKAGKFTGKIELGAGAFNLVDLGDGKVAAMCGSTIKMVDYVEGVVEGSIELPGIATDAVVSPDGNILFASGTGLFELHRNGR